VQAFVSSEATQRVGYPTVHQALAAAAADETVMVCPGTHDLSQEGGTLAVTRPVRLVAEASTATPVLDLVGPGTVVQVESGVTDVFIVGLAITGSTDGRGLAVGAGATVTLTDSVITANGGGGVMVDDGATVELDDTLVSNNTATEGGAGIRADNGTVRLLNGSIVAMNYASESGGGVSCFGYGTLSIEQSLITGNVTDRSGGGIVNNCTLSIVGDSEIAGNTAHSNGGGLADSGIDGLITDTTITGNHADVDGGGISCLESNGLELTRATVSGNTAGQRGGGASVTGGTLRSTETDWGTPEVDDNSPADVSFMDSNYDYSGMVSFECEETTGCISL
jgi:predicted outer membrane repeat protein